MQSANAQGSDNFGREVEVNEGVPQSVQWPDTCFICTDKISVYGYMKGCSLHTACYTCLHWWLTQNSPHCPQCRSLVTKLAPCKSIDEANLITWSTVDVLDLTQRVFEHLDEFSQIFFSEASAAANENSSDDETFESKHSESESFNEADDDDDDDDRPSTPPSFWEGLSRGPEFDVDDGSEVVASDDFVVSSSSSSSSNDSSEFSASESIAVITSPVRRPVARRRRGARIFARIVAQEDDSSITRSR